MQRTFTHEFSLQDASYNGWAPNGEPLHHFASKTVVCGPGANPIGIRVLQSYSSDHSVTPTVAISDYTNGGTVTLNADLLYWEENPNVWAQVEVTCGN